MQKFRISRTFQSRQREQNREVRKDKKISNLHPVVNQLQFFVKSDISKKVNRFDFLAFLVKPWTPWTNEL